MKKRVNLNEKKLDTIINKSVKKVLAEAISPEIKNLYMKIDGRLKDLGDVSINGFYSEPMFGHICVQARNMGSGAVDMQQVDDIMEDFGYYLYDVGSNGVYAMREYSDKKEKLTRTYKFDDDENTYDGSKYQMESISRIVSDSIMKRIRLTEEKLRLIVKESVKRILAESYEKPLDISQWVLVGQCKNDNFCNEDGISFIFVNPDFRNYDGPEWRFKTENVRIAPNRDGSGQQGTLDDIVPYHRQDIKVYPEHRNDEHGDVILGERRPTEEMEATHREFMSRLNIDGNRVILHHNSSVHINDGMVKKGKPNLYSRNSDVGIYFWASENSGSDPSSNGRYTYFCSIPLSNLYDFETNEERLTLTQALSEYGYAGQFWRNNNAIVVNTYKETPIEYIRDNTTGEFFDANWEKIE